MPISPIGRRAKDIHLYVLLILTSHVLYVSLSTGTEIRFRIPNPCSLPANRAAKRKVGNMLTNLDRFMDILLAAIFILIGAWQIVSYGRRPKSLGARHRSLPLGLPYGFVIAVGLIEIVAALGLVIPFGPIPPATLALVAASGLALLTLTAAIYRMRRHQSPVPSVMLFLLALFVILGHTV
jgi:hypothetical protein